MRLLCRLKFRDGRVADSDRAQTLLKEGVRELASFVYYLGIVESRKSTGGTGGGESRHQYASPEEAEEALLKSVEEASGAAVLRADILQQARRTRALPLEQSRAREEARLGAAAHASYCGRGERTAADQLENFGDAASRRSSGLPEARLVSAGRAADLVDAQTTPCSCTSCGSSLSLLSKFCGDCGAAALCRGCGSRYAPSAKFCSECGLKRPLPCA